MEKKMTYAEAIDIAIATMTNEEAIQKLLTLKEKQSKKGKVSEKVQKERNDFDNLVLGAMTTSDMTVTEILANMGNPEGITSSKVTSALGRLLKVNAVVNSKDKGKSLYRLA